MGQELRLAYFQNSKFIGGFVEFIKAKLTSFIRLIADEGVKRFHYSFVAAIAAHGG